MEAKIQYRNPVIPGFYPDPSVIRVGKKDYYLVTSSFEYFPGVPIFHSHDLVNWKQIGHVLTRTDQLDLSTRASSQGIYAPTLRYHNGRFYMITTDARGRGNFYVTAEDPAGPWSDPIRIPYGNIDPSLFFDDDGKVYVTVQNGFAETSHIIQYEIDIETGQALTEPVPIFHGDGGVWTEAPHLYKINGLYYLLAACGGTEFNHRAIVARSKDPYGPYTMMDFPMLTHNQLLDHPLQCLGHADLVEDDKGQWWAVFLGVRPAHEERSSVLGRETFLAPVHWSEDGWPMIDNNEGTVDLLMDGTLLPGVEKYENGPERIVNNDAFTEIRDDFDKEELDVAWNFVRAEDREMYSLNERPGMLRLTGKAVQLSDVDVPAFICRRQQHVHMQLTASVYFEPNENGEEAGLAARYDEKNHYVISVKRMENNRFVVAYKVSDGEKVELGRKPLEDAQVYLRLSGNAEQYEFHYSTDEGKSWKNLGQAPAVQLTAQRNGGFTGVCIGMYATGNGQQSTTPAWFDWVHYEGVN